MLYNYDPRSPLGVSVFVQLHYEQIFHARRLIPLPIILDNLHLALLERFGYLVGIIFHYHPCFSLQSVEEERASPPTALF